MERTDLRCAGCNRCLARVLEGTGGAVLDFKCRCGHITIIHLTFVKKNVQILQEKL